MNRSIFEIQPIGGVGEIGSNMTLMKIDQEMILIDCGILFPENNQFDINYLIPNYATLPSINKIIITHGHEDHIGAVSHLLDALPDIEIFCTDFTKELILRKFHFLKRAAPKLNLISINDSINFADYNLDFIHVNHSIPQTMGLLFTAKKHSLAVFYASDFKVDHISPYEKPFDFDKLTKLSCDMKKRIFLCDSTNIISTKNKTTSEAELIKDLQKIISLAEARTFITLFSSNIHRLQTLIHIAKKTNKKIVLHGRAMSAYVQMAKKCYLLDVDENIFIEAVAAKAYADKNLLIIVSGCQADFKSALNRIISDNDPAFKLTDKDTFIFSSKAIPGNEKKIAEALNKITMKGTSLYTPDNALIHASGHPCKADLLEVYEKYAPTEIVPIHGETFFLERHCQYINRVYPQASSIKLTNYDKLIVDDELNFKINASPSHEPLIIHGKGVEIKREKLKQRRKVGHSGCVLFSARRDDLLKFKQNFKIEYIGIPEINSEQQEQFEFSLTDVLKTSKIKKTTDLEDKIKIHIRQFINKLFGYKPVTIVHLV